MATKKNKRQDGEDQKPTGGDPAAEGESIEPRQDGGATEPSIDFEVELTAIEKIVRDLEGGQLSLDDSLQSYESAVNKMRQCYKLLEVAERRISIVSGVDANGQPIAEPMLDAADSADESTESLSKKQQSRARRRGAGPSTQ